MTNELSVWLEEKIKLMMVEAELLRRILKELKGGE